MQVHLQAPNSIVGTWSGMIEIDDTPVPVVLRIDGTDKDGRDPELSATADFPQHRRTGVAFSDVSFEQGMLRFATKNMGTYAGHMSSDGRSIVGALSNKDKRYPLTLSSGDI